jgi:hypothetical protein
MSTIELKKNIHSLVDSIENENLLMKFYDIMSKMKEVKNGQLWTRLSKEDQEVLLLSEMESDDPKNLLSYSEMEKKHSKWL